MVNTQMLKAAITKKGLNQSQLAAQMGICKASLSYKLNNLTEFTIGEVEQMCNILDISDEFMEIFFAK